MTVSIREAPPSGIDNNVPPNVDVSVPACCNTTQPDLLIATISLTRDCLCDTDILLGWDGGKWSSTFAGLPGNRIRATCCDGFQVELDLTCSVSGTMISICESGFFRLETNFSDPQNSCLDCVACDSGCPSGLELGLTFNFFPLDNACCDCCFDVIVAETGGPFFTNDLICRTGRASLPTNLKISNPLGGCSCATDDVIASYNGSGVWSGSFSDRGESCCGQGKNFSASVKCCERGEVTCGGACDDGKFELQWTFTDGCDDFPFRRKCVLPTCPPSGQINATFNDLCFDGDCCSHCSCTGAPDIMNGFFTVINVPTPAATGDCPLGCEADCSGPLILHRKPNVQQDCVWKGLYTSGSGCVGVGTPIVFQMILTLFQCKEDVLEVGGARGGDLVIDACGKFEIIPDVGCAVAHTRALSGGCSIIDEDWDLLDFDSCCQTAVCFASGQISLMG